MSVTTRTAAIAKLVFAFGIALLALAALCHPALIARFHFRQPLSNEALTETAVSRATFLIGGSGLLLLGWVIRRELGPAALLHRRAVARGFLIVLFLALPLFVLERALRPFVERLTSIYVRDRELGWKHRPRAEDTYWGARVRINAHGMRGPDRAPAKPPGTRRVLVLGDSVVFGLMIEDDAQTLPALLEGELAARRGNGVECLNAAVCGWSPWQQQVFLQREGERWQPDLVVLGFVLNDVTEPFELERFGGQGQGAQLAHARSDSRPHWFADSGLWLFARGLRGRLAFGADPARAAAERERLNVYHLIFQPDAAPVQRAWKAALGELDGIFAWCRARSIPFVLVVFPYAVQLDRPDANAPQSTLERFAAGRDLPSLDLLPPLVAAARARARGSDGAELFYDALHATPLGNQVAAEEIARLVIARSLLR